MGFISSIICFIGFLGILHFLWYVYKILYAYFAKPKNLKNENVNWCLITGASSGVGYELALKVAKQGVNIIALGRNEERLSKLEQDIKNNQCKIEIIKISIDFSDYEKVGKLFSELIPQQMNNQNISVDSLFLCHGGATIKIFEEFTNEEIEKYNNSFITSNVIISKDFINQGGKAITAVSSANSFVYSAYVDQYGAVKRWMNRFFNALKIESDIPIQILNPGVIKNTRFFDDVPEGMKPIVKPPESSLTPDRVADMILTTYGKNFEVDVGIDCIAYRCVFWLFPPQIIDFIMSHVGKQFEKGIKTKTD